MDMPDLTGWTLVFDLDGTLIDSAPDLHAALNYCLTRAGYGEVAFELISGMIGQGAKAMIRKALAHQNAEAGPGVVEGLWSDFLKYYRNNICVFSRVYDGAEIVLDAIREAGGICAVCTNKTQSLSEAAIGGLNLSDYFKAIVGADAVPEKKPDGDHILRTIDAAGGDAKRAIMIGDSQTDEKAARNAGLPFIFVSFGYGPQPDDLSGPAGICRAYSDLPDLISALCA
ncbi:MAG: HAD-IA family hydrolase [Henriciella sp.]|uniref:HAD-IA family hydrolase n=1 Tax=Henriciella sp. TaxID=1968823 RepID=UPI003C78FC8F